MTEQAKRIFGIDLGTTYSSIAYVDQFGKAVIIPNAENERVTPSVVFFDEDCIVVGDVAKENSKIYPLDVASFVKRSMGEPNFIFFVKGEKYSAEEISAYILKKLAKDAEQNIGEKVTDVVITCPAYFGINEREATRKAGEIAGLNVRQIINEPTAAAIAYGALNTTEDRVVLVYDLGGGTFDITMIDIRKDSVTVICTGGDHHLGGKDWDDRIVAYLVEAFQAGAGLNEDILDEPDTLQDLQLSAEKAKKNLSQRTKAPVSVTHGGERVKVLLEREKFEELTADLLERTVEFTRDMLNEAKRKGYEHFDEFILVGGATRMPQVKEKIMKEFSVTPKIFDPDEAVAKGAAIFGWKMTINDGLIQRFAEKTNKPVHQMKDIAKMIENKEFTPHDVKEVTRQVADETGHTLPSIESAMMKVKNVTSKSFGIITYNSQDEVIVFNIILRNSELPVARKRIFYTTVEEQKSVLIRIMESETSQIEIPADHAVEINTAVLHLPPDLPADLPVEITFILNEEGRLFITAMETSQSRQMDVVVDTASVIQGEELEKAKDRSQRLVIH